VAGNNELAAKFKDGKEYLVSSSEFLKVPSYPIAYWITERLRSAFSANSSIGEKAKKGLSSGNNEAFVRFWFEPSALKLSLFNGKKWFPMTKGGEFRKWYGNNEYVIDWEDNGKRLKAFAGAAIRNQSFYLQQGITWNDVSISHFSSRFVPEGFICNAAGPMIYGGDVNLLLTLTNSKVTASILKFLSPTVKFEVGSVSKIPVISNPTFDYVKLGQDAVKITKEDWDSFETSWDFKRFPMIGALPQSSSAFPNTTASFPQEPAAFPKTTAEFPQTTAAFPKATAAFPQTPAEFPQTTAAFPQEPAEFPQEPAEFPQAPAKSPVEAAWNAWKLLCDSRITRMQQLETDNNRLFIDAYGLQDELSPEVPLEQITLARADAEKDARRLLSYFIGCLMGRYSLDEAGLIYADSGGTGFDPPRYRSFAADDDGIVPVTDLEWFPQEAATRLAHFVRVAFRDAGQGTRDENSVNSVNSVNSANLKWIAGQLGAKANETSVETIRRYFSASFFKDHLQTYKKRPIYWLFSSGKQKAFECLVYLHRYNENTLPRMRHEYVLPLMSKLTGQLENLDREREAAQTSGERTRIERQQETLRKKQTELTTFDEKLRHYSDMKIRLDLDEGVKVNYGKFGDLLAEVKQVAATKE
jgi:hypothetical protein